MTAVRMVCGVSKCKELAKRTVKLIVKTLPDPVEVPLCAQHLSVHNEGAARLRVEAKQPSNQKG